MSDRAYEIGRLMTNVLPMFRPGLLARTEPPCSSTRVLTIESPRPSPPKRRVVLASAWRKRWNTYGRKSGAIPIPLSSMQISA